MTRGFGETLWGASSHPIEGIRVSRQEGRRRRESRHFCSNGSDGEMDLHVPYSDETIFRGSEHSTDVIFHAVELTVADRRFREDDTRDSLRVFPHRQVLSGEEVRQRESERRTRWILFTLCIKLKTRIAPLEEQQKIPSSWCRRRGMEPVSRVIWCRVSPVYMSLTKTLLSPPEKSLLPTMATESTSRESV
jgi:hypothetical protein